MTLKDAIEISYGKSMRHTIRKSAIRELVASLESNGYCIVPMEATEEMNKAAYDVTGDWNQTWPAFLSKRPKLDDA